MWPFHTITNEIVTIQLQPDTIVCSWITTANKIAPTYSLRGYQRTTLANFSCAQGILFNPTTIITTITTFLQQHSLEQSFIALSTCGSGITEFILDMPQASPAHTDFPLQKLHKLVWDYRYLYPKDNAHYAVYVCGMSRQLRAQYTLLAFNASLNTILLTTEFMALLEVYRQMYGSAFRRAQLARDMQRHNNQLLNVLQADTLRRMVTVDPALSISLEQELPWLFTALGLYVTGKNLP